LIEFKGQPRHLLKGEIKHQFRLIKAQIKDFEPFFLKIYLFVELNQLLGELYTWLAPVGCKIQTLYLNFGGDFGLSCDCSIYHLD
jgi:hypothetical protein